MSSAQLAAHVDPGVLHHDDGLFREYLFTDGSRIQTRGRGCNFHIYYKGEQVI